MWTVQQNLKRKLKSTYALFNYWDRFKNFESFFLIFTTVDTGSVLSGLISTVKCLKKISGIEQFWNSDIESCIQDTTISMQNSYYVLDTYVLWMIFYYIKQAQKSISCSIWWMNNSEATTGHESQTSWLRP